LLAAAAVCGLGLLPASSSAQVAPSTAPATRPAAAIPPELMGRNVEAVRILGRTRPLSSELLGQIRQQIRTAEGERLDPDTVREDYQRVYGLGKFSNVEARVELTAGGVVVIYEISEQDLVRSIAFKGNRNLTEADLRDVIGDLMIGQSIDGFRLAAARDGIERLYRSKNYPYAHVTVDNEALRREGAVVLNIVEGPRVTVRKVAFSGNKSFTDGKLADQVKTDTWFPVIRAGTFDPDQVDQDVAAVRQFYEDNGFFDARVGRTLSFSEDQTELKVTFVVEEGQRYVVDRVLFKGNNNLPDADLRKDLRILPGRPYERDLVRRDVRQIVRAYSPLGYVFYQPPGTPPNPDYLQVRPREVFHREAGKVDVIYEISEGRAFKVGRILVTGNQRTNDKVVLRELRVAPGMTYNSGELQDALDRVRATKLFTDVRLTPLGDQPDEREVLIEVVEQSTSRILVGGAVTSNSGIMGNLTYEQDNFDLTALPSRLSDITEGRAFIGAGQKLRLNLEPGTQVSRASVDFVEPWVFDQPYSVGISAYVSDRLRDQYSEGKAGGRVWVGKTFIPHWSVKLNFRGEDVQIHDVDNEIDRSPQIVGLEGHNTVTSAGFEVRRNTTDSPILPSQGSILALSYDYAGAMGGDFRFHRLGLSADLFHMVYEDLLDRKTTLRYHANVGYISGEAPFFERFYGGGLGSIRGFRYRGVGPRSGAAEDPVGGDFLLVGGVELNFPLWENSLRGVVFVDAGTVEPRVQVSTMRLSVGLGIRWTPGFLGPMLGQVPIALDFGVPVIKNDQDDIQIFSFSLGLVR
jgi:outer membrane protein assembly complex protein YaeT